MKSPQFLEQFPPRKPRRHQWSSRRLLPIEVDYLSKDRTKTASIRGRFYRFNTKPNWGANAVANRAAFLLLQDSR